MYSNRTREYLHIITFPNLFNQDIILRGMISNLTAKDDNLIAEIE